MILDFGYICIDLSLTVASADIQGRSTTAQKTEIFPGGRGLNQALAAARMGAKVSLIGAIGEDLFGKEIITRLQREGITTSGIAKTKRPTGMVTRIADSNGIGIEVLSPGANEMAKASQISPMGFNVRTLLMLQDDVPEDENLSLLQRAQAGGATTLLNVRTEKVLHSIAKEADFIVVSESFEAPEGFEGVFILNSPQVATALLPDGKRHNIETPYPSSDFNKFFAEDCFCGAFAACLQAGGDIKSALGYGRAMAYLAGSAGTTREKFPYLDEVTALLQAENNQRITA